MRVLSLRSCKELEGGACLPFIIYYKTRLPAQSIDHSSLSRLVAQQDATEKIMKKSPCCLLDKIVPRDEV